MAATIAFRPDDDARLALEELTSDGTPVSTTVLRPLGSCKTWRLCARGDVYRLRAPRGQRGHEQQVVCVRLSRKPMNSTYFQPGWSRPRPSRHDPPLSGRASTWRRARGDRACRQWVAQALLLDQCGSASLQLTRPVMRSLRPPVAPTNRSAPPVTPHTSSHRHCAWRTMGGWSSSDCEMMA